MFDNFARPCINLSAIDSVIIQLMYPINSTGQFSVPTSCAYCITKYGVEAFSDALRREMSPWNVRISIIEPGSFSTCLMDGDKAERIIRGCWESLSEEIKENYSEEYLERSTES